LAEHPEQELDTAATERDVSQLVADQQLGPFQLTQELIQRVLLLSLFELANELRGREEAHAQTLSASSLTQGDGDVGFPSSRGTDLAAIKLVIDPFAPRRLQDLWLGDLRQAAGVERLEVIPNRKHDGLDS